MNFLMNDAYAQAQNAAAGQPNAFQSLMPFILIFVVFYFLIIRPNKKRMQEEQNFINALSKGQEVYTKSGLIGKIDGLTEKVVTLEVSEGTKIKILRSHISGLAAKLFEAKKTVEKAAKKK